MSFPPPKIPSQKPTIDAFTLRLPNHRCFVANFVFISVWIYDCEMCAREKACDALSPPHIVPQKARVAKVHEERDLRHLRDLSR